jgi:LAS superfamily LD-carboxypeptidase LdcB
MTLRSPFMFSAAFLALAATYTGWFNVVVRTDVHAAASRFEALRGSGLAGRAAPYGERVLRMRREGGADEETLAPLKAEVARAQISARNYARGAALMEEALTSGWSRALPGDEKLAMEDNLARAYALAGDVAEAVGIYAFFLEQAGDEASRTTVDDPNTAEAAYIGKVRAAANLFAEALKPKDRGASIEGDVETRLLIAKQMAALGGFYAAAGLLSAAYGIRSEILGQQDPATVQAALLLGPVFVEMGRLSDAEALYLEAFHAQEKVKGSNSPDLSLYIKLLAGVYEKQGRATEAQALYEHMRSLFRDAFGAQRYAANRARDRRSDIDRPVSQHFPLPPAYAPRDLISAVDYSVPLSKSAELDEMKLRLAADEGEDPREANLPARLAQLISLCRSESGERLGLRSGYRSYRTQKELYARIGVKGTVTPPGMSEHQTGLAADIDVDGRLMRTSDAAYHCFVENAFSFGFILSYPPGNDYLPATDSFEPWHWRYVGVETARLFREAGVLNKPQEFLAALPCYRERAAAGFFPAAGEADVCQSGAKVVAALETAEDDAQPAGEIGGDHGDLARKLNNPAQGARAH